jgi:hypothetical protein
MDWVINPETKRKVLIGSKKYLSLVRKGIIIPRTIDIVNNPNIARTMCKEDQVLNPNTKRCIKKTGQLYRDLKKKGVEFYEEMDFDMPMPSPTARRNNARKG